MNQKKAVIMRLLGVFTVLLWMQINPANSQITEPRFLLQLPISTNTSGLNTSSVNQILQKHFYTSANYSWKLLSEYTDSKAISHRRYQELFNGVEIENAIAILHFSPNGSVFISGICIKIELANQIQIISEASAKSIPEKVHTIEQIKLVYAQNEAKQFSLHYKIEYTSNESLLRKHATIDAVTSKLICNVTNACYADALGIAHTANHGTQNITTCSQQGHFKLTANNRGQGIETRNLNQQLNYNAITDFIDNDNIWDQTNLVGENYAADAHFCAEQYYDFLQNKFNRNSIDGNGKKLISYLNYGNGLRNAFWNGDAVVYGSGNVTAGPLTTIDIAGHEFSHGLIQQSANLNYSGEPGIINEAIADILGVATEHYAMPQNADWLVGEKSGLAIRSMAEPELFGQPSTYIGPNWYTGTGDNGGVHINSGFINKWFYLLSQGGIGVNNLGTNYSVQGISIDKATQLVYHSLLVYTLPTTGFFDFMKITLQSSIDFYGICSPEYLAVREAWKAVGLYDYSNAPAQIIVPSNLWICTGSSINISANGLPGSIFKWYLNGNLISSGLNSELTVTQPGNYQLEENRCGSTFTSLNVTLTERQLPSVTASNYELCEGTPLHLNALPSGGSYSITNPYLGLTTNYAYQYTDSFGCTNTANAHITIDQLPVVSILNSEISFPENYNPVELKSNVQGIFTGTGVNGNFFYPDLASQGGPYPVYLQFTNAAGCTNYETIEFTVTTPCKRTVNEINISDEPIILSGNSVTRIKINATLEDFSIAWKLPSNLLICANYGDSILDVQLTNGTVEVEAVLTNECGEQFSIKRNIASASFSEPSLVAVYPNPASDFTTVEIADFLNPLTVTICDSKGKTIKNFKMNSAKQKIDLSKLSKGLYLLKIKNAATKKIVVN
jgi:Zn-dependent metalloprotease